jgi:hypothetical protein
MGISAHVQYDTQKNKNYSPYVGQHTEVPLNVSSTALKCEVLTKIRDTQVATLWSNDQVK